MKIKNIGITFLILICFLMIRYNYNGGPSSTIFDLLWFVISESYTNNWNFSIHNFTMNFTYNLIEFILISIFILTAVLSGKKIMILFGMLVLFCLWAFWLNCYRDLLNINLYLTSSIPFIASNIIMILFLFKKKSIEQCSTKKKQRE